MKERTQDEFLRYLDLAPQITAVLKKLGVHDVESLLDMDMNEFKRQPRMGSMAQAKVMQLRRHYQDILKDKPSPTPNRDKVEAFEFETFRQQVAEINNMMRRNPNFFAMPIDRGFLVAMRCARDSTDRG